MQTDLQNRRQECEEAKTTLQPSIYKVKEESPASKPVYYVNVNKITYNFRSCLKALDIATKLHQVLNLCYQHASNQSYIFIQRLFFKIITKHDKVSPPLAILIKKCEM